jgi:hypothetical protein
MLFKELNHGSFGAVGLILPDFKARWKWLKQNGEFACGMQDKIPAI